MVRREAGAGRGEPLFFHHIAKTGGTSLIDAIRSATAPELCFTEDGNLSAASAQGLVDRGLRPGQFIYGHPQIGAARPLRGRAAFVTLLRQPRDQAISCYLHIRTHPSVPDYKFAQELDFPDFLLARPYFAFFQAASLNVGIAQTPPESAQGLLDRLPAILDYLFEIRFLGTVEGAGSLLGRIAEATAWPRPPRYPHRRRRRISEDRLAKMRQQYAELLEHPTLAPLLAAEQLVYQTALDREAADSSAPA